MIDQIDPDSATLFAELLHGTDPDLDLHLILRSRGGDGEVAVRLARMAQAACRRFVVVVPDIAKSAATIFALGAHEIVMIKPGGMPRQLARHGGLARWQPWQLPRASAGPHPRWLHRRRRRPRT